MGPPPDPEHMASMLENPNFASTLNEALANPQVIDQMIRSNPMLRDMGPQVRQMMQDPSFRRMMTDPAALRNISQMQRQFGGGMFGGMGGGGNQAFPAPGITDTTPGQQPSAEGNTATPGQPDATPQQPPNPFAMFGNPAGAGAGGAGAANPFAALFGGMGGNTPGSPPPAGTQAPGATPQQGANSFADMTRNIMQNPEAMQQMQQMVGAMGANPTATANPDPNNPTANSAAQTGFNPFAVLQGLGGMGAFGGAGGLGSPASPPAPQDDRPLEDRYAEQLRQLNDMGFYEFERNIEALRRTGGSVQGAVEYLLTH